MGKLRRIREIRVMDKEKRMNDKKLICTADEDTASALRKSGFREMKTGNKNIYTFLNNTTLKFSEGVDINKIKYSNMLTF
jgi:hypothetical protein